MDFQKRDDKKWMKHTMIAVNTEGKAIINESGLNVITADDLDDAAQKIVTAVKG